MEEKINIAEILKNKPQGTKLYDLLYNVDVELDTISTTDTESVVWCTNETDNNTTCHRGYSEFGTLRGCPDGLQILFPSKEMRDWSKFAWKKGDVLVSKHGTKEVIFDGFDDDYYVTFKGKHALETIEGISEYKGESDDSYDFYTENYYLESEDAAQIYINTLEKIFGGKLNRETLEIEKAQPEFKDGDVVALDTRYIDSDDVIVESFIVRGDYKYGDDLKFYAACSNNKETDVVYNSSIMINKTSVRKESLRLSTEEEKQQLFSALAKEGKVWDAEKKQVVDLKPKVELKPFDNVLVRHQKTEEWRANTFSHTDKTDEYLDYVCVNGRWEFCIPYEGNESLLGTTNNVEG